MRKSDRQIIHIMFKFTASVLMVLFYRSSYQGSEDNLAKAFDETRDNIEKVLKQWEEEE